MTGLGGKASARSLVSVDGCSHPHGGACDVHTTSSTSKKASMIFFFFFLSAIPGRDYYNAIPERALEVTGGR